MKPQKTIEELKKEFANKIAKIKLKEKKEKEKIKLNSMNDLIINLEKNEYFRNELFNLLNSNNLNNIVIEIEKIIVLKPNNQNINTNENENI
jgi:hypothetical protein